MARSCSATGASWRESNGAKRRCGRGNPCYKVKEPSQPDCTVRSGMSPPTCFAWSGGFAAYHRIRRIFSRVRSYAAGWPGSIMGTSAAAAGRFRWRRIGLWTGRSDGRGSAALCCTDWKSLPGKRAVHKCFWSPKSSGRTPVAFMKPTASLKAMPDIRKSCKKIGEIHQFHPKCNNTTKKGRRHTPSFFLPFLPSPVNRGPRACGPVPFRYCILTIFGTGLRLICFANGPGDLCHGCDDESITKVSNLLSVISYLISLPGRWPAPGPHISLR